MKYVINNKDYSNEVNGLMNFAQKRFDYSNQPKVHFNDDLKNSHKTLGKTGYYDPNNTEIHIYATGRHIKDILRSLAHELVHHMQNENGDLSHDGYMGQGYAQKNPQMREMERQAYEMGNLCFRDWEDSLKQKHPTIYNERRNRNMSLKDWKNKELNENLNNKWGFKMILNEMGMGAGPMDPMAGQSSMEGEPPMNQDEVRIEQCIEEKTMMMQPQSSCDEAAIRKSCEEEMQSSMPQEEPGMQRDSEIPFQESKDKKPDEDGDGVPDYADEKPGEDDNKDDKKDSNKKFKPKKGEIPPQFKKNMKESLNRKIRVKIRK